MKQTLLNALIDASRVIYRGDIGCYFVEDNTSVGNGYTVFFNSNSDTPIEYTDPVRILSTGSIHRLPFIVSPTNGRWYRNFEELEIAMGKRSDELAWESVRALRVEGAQG